jgi:hypothetical protein
MTIETEAAWQADGGDWSHETGKDHQNELWVRVNLNDGTGPCRISGHPVQVEYSEGGFKAIFNPAGNPVRTKVSPRGQIDLETAQRLRHGASGDGGYITGVRIPSAQLECKTTKDNLVDIAICSSASVAACQ